MRVECRWSCEGREKREGGKVHEIGKNEEGKGERSNVMVGDKERVVE